MLAMAHLAAGTAIGRRVPKAWVALPVALASHFLLDTVPHVSNLSLLAPGGPSARADAAAAVADLALGGAFVAAALRRAPNRVLVAAAALMAAAPDADNLPGVGPWLHTSAASAPLVAFHHAIQTNLTAAQWPFGLASLAAVVGLSWWFASRGPQRPTSA